MKNFTQVPNEIIRSGLLDAYELKVFLYLLSFSRGRCYPSYDDIGNNIGINKKTVYNAIHRLKIKGAISWRRGTQGKHNLYSIYPVEKWVKTN